jgi:hypothetical protein
MSTLEVKAFSLQLSTAIDGLEKRIDHAVRQSLQVTQALDQQAKHSLETSNNLTLEALAQIRQGTKQAITEGGRDAVQELDHTMREGAQRMDQAIAQLELHLQHVRRVNTSHAWKTFVASAVGSLAVIAVAAYVSFQAHADIKRSEWIQQINAAVDTGQLAPCPDAGLCVHVNNKWVRLRGK